MRPASVNRRASIYPAGYPVELGVKGEVEGGMGRTYDKPTFIARLFQLPVLQGGL